MQETKQLSNEPPEVRIFQQNGDELKRVNLTIAREYDRANSELTVDEFYHNSGLKLLHDTIFKNIEEKDIKSCFFEYSTLCSTIDGKGLSSFLCLLKKDESLNENQLAGKLSRIISRLYQKKLSLYYLQKFFIQPESDDALITILPDFKKSIYYNNSIQEKFENFLTNYANAQLPANFIERTDSLIPVNNDSSTFVQNLTFSEITYEQVIENSRHFSQDTPLPNHLLLHHLYDEELFQNKQKNLKTILISVPMLGAPIFGNKYCFNGQGAFFLYLITEKDIPRTNLENLVRDISNFNRDITYNYLFEVGFGKAKEARKNACNAAIAQVMNRQKSHNINSHVLANLVNLKSYDNIDVKSFLRYLQSRIEFIADIVTAEPLVTFPSRLSDDILKKFLGRMDQKETWPFYILQYISGSNEVTYGTGLQKNISIQTQNEEDLCIALPNDTLGAQAFYVILENIIRNSVKHSIISEMEESFNSGTATKTKKLLQLTIYNDKSFTHPDFYKIIIWDNLGKVNSEYRGKQDLGENNNLSFDQWMNSKIDREILDISGKLRQNDWGLLEMKICAAYLRKFALVDLDNRSVDPPLFNMILDNEKNLGYELYLLKPKLACIVFQNEIPADLNVDEFSLRGIHLVKKHDLEELNQLLKYGELKLKNSNKHEVSHPYLILEEGVLNDTLIVTSNQSWLELNESDIKALLQSDNIELNILKNLVPTNELKVIKCLNDNDCVPEFKSEDCLLLQPQETNFDISDFYDKIVFHRHGEKHLHSEIEESKYPKGFYYEPWGTQDATGWLITNNPDLCIDKETVLKYELNLAASLQVGILDERIQSEAQKENGKKRIILHGMKIFIPNEDLINLNLNSFSNKNEDEKSVADKIKEWINKNKLELDYIVIHQGIVEKAIGSTNIQDITQFINDYYNSIGTNMVKAQLVIISGRGKPSNLPFDVFYLPFSLINQYVITYRSKIYLYKLLKSARRYHG